MQLVIGQMMHWEAGNSWELPSWSCAFLGEPQATLRVETEHFFHKVQQMSLKIKDMSHTSEEQSEEGKFMTLSCAWPLPNTSLPWGLILSCKRDVSIMEIKLRIDSFLPGAVICFRLLKNPSGQLGRVGNLNNKRISEEIRTVSRLASFSNINFQFKSLTSV